MKGKILELEKGGTVGITSTAVLCFQKEDQELTSTTSFKGLWE